MHTAAKPTRLGPWQWVVIALGTALACQTALAAPWAVTAPLGTPIWTATAENQKPKKPKKDKAAKAPKVTPSSSDETRAERDRRLQRECKGRPNAGACLGYAS